MSPVLYYTPGKSNLHLIWSNKCTDLIYLTLLLKFSIFLGALNKLKIQHQEDPNSTTLVANKPFLLRSLFTVGALARHFDFDLEEFKGTNRVRCKLMFVNSSPPLCLAVYSNICM